MEEIIIVGGGVAGLSCLNALLDHGKSALLLEAKAIGSPKMCGEFIAPQALPTLNKWGIDPIPIKQVIFNARDSRAALHFNQLAGAYSRSQAEQDLAKRALKMGGQIRSGIAIEHFIPGNSTTPFTFFLANGEKLQTKHVFFASGKLNLERREQVAPAYFGFKFHIKKIIASDSLLMFSLPGAYLGLIPVSKDTSNCACLIKAEARKKFASCKDFFQQVFLAHPTFKQLFTQQSVADIPWFETSVPHFKMASTLPFPHAHWIGDAKMNFYPAMGYGFAHSVQSAVLSVQHFLHKDSAYQQNYVAHSKRIRHLSKVLHHLLLQPIFASSLLRCLHVSPFFTRRLLAKIGY